MKIVDNRVHEYDRLYREIRIYPFLEENQTYNPSSGFLSVMKDAEKPYPCVAFRVSPQVLIPERLDKYILALEQAKLLCDNKYFDDPTSRLLQLVKITMEPECADAPKE